MNAFLFFCYRNRMLIFFLFSTNIENRVQIRPILYSSHPIRLQIFFRVNDNDNFPYFNFDGHIYIYMYIYISSCYNVYSDIAYVFRFCSDSYLIFICSKIVHLFTDLFSKFYLQNIFI